MSLGLSLPGWWLGGLAVVTYPLPICLLWDALRVSPSPHVNSMRSKTPGEDNLGDVMVIEETLLPSFQQLRPEQLAEQEEKKDGSPD